MCECEVKSEIVSEEKKVEVQTSARRRLNKSDGRNPVDRQAK